MGYFRGRKSNCKRGNQSGKGIDLTRNTANPERRPFSLLGLSGMKGDRVLRMKLPEKTCFSDTRGTYLKNRALKGVERGRLVIQDRHHFGATMS